MTSNGQEMVKAFEYVYETYVNAAKMLMAADGVLGEDGWGVYPQNPARWPELDATNLSPGRLRVQCRSWLAYYVQRHFLRVSEPQNQRRIYLSAVFWDPWGTEPLKQPLCIAAMFEKAKVQGNEFYTSALMQLWSLARAPADGIPHLLGEDLSHLLPDYQASVRGCLQGPRLLSVAVPLLEIENTDALASRVLTPLLQASTRLSEALKQAQQSAALAQTVSSVSELDLAQLQRENADPEQAPVAG